MYLSLATSNISCKLPDTGFEIVCTLPSFQVTCSLQEASDASFLGSCLSKHPNSFIDHEAQIVYTIGEMCYSSAMTINMIKKEGNFK